jgi:hypothetical protein
LSFENNIKTSFQKVKESILALDKRISVVESDISSIKTMLDSALSSHNKDNYSSDESKTTQTPEFNVLKAPKPQIQESSIGNEGVPLRHSDDTAPTKRRQTDTPTTPNSEEYTHIQTLKKELNSRFLSLTEAQFNVFMTIYQLEEEKGNPVTYAEVAKHIMISQSSVRDYVSDLILRNIPLTKHKSPNRKIYLSIKKEFRNLKILENLLALREKDHSQTQLTGHLRQYF